MEANSVASRKPSAKRPERKSILSRIVSYLCTLLTGSIAGSWFGTDMPVIGPVVSQFVNERIEESSLPQIAKDKLQSEINNRIPGANGTANSYSPNFPPPATGGSPPPGTTYASGPSVGGTGSVLNQTSYQTNTTPAAPQRPSGKPTDRLFVASFNIQVFGESKASKPAVMNVLAEICRYFDIVAIQEIRSKNDQLIPNFVQQINSDGSRYAHVIGPRLGRTVSTEQYVYVFDTSRVEVESSSVGTLVDSNDLLHREPMIARFRSIPQGRMQPFSFWLVNIHTDPDEVKEEIDVLADVFQLMQRANPEEDDVILLGDLNASETQLGRLGQLPGMQWAIQGQPTNTRQTKSYDNLLFSLPATREYTGRSGVVDFEKAFRLTREQALEVSDHLPVWAEFSAFEAVGAFASGGN